MPRAAIRNAQTRELQSRLAEQLRKVSELTSAQLSPIPTLAIPSGLKSNYTSFRRLSREPRITSAVMSPADRWQPYRQSPAFQQAATAGNIGQWTITGLRQAGCHRAIP